METHLARLERREQALIARSELLEGRIGEGGRAEVGADAGGRGMSGGGGGNGEAVRGGGERLKQLRGKKERLGYAVERLNLQAQQRERQLRMSVAGK